MSFTEQKIWEIAAVCHEANRAFCKQHGDYSHKTWGETPKHIQLSTVAGVKTAMNEPEANGYTMHKAWVERKLKEGWTFGAVKDLERLTHPNLRPYIELPAYERFKDHLFLAIVDAFVSFEVQEGDDGE